MVDTKGRTVFDDESEKASGTAHAAEEELKESIRLNTFRVYTLQEMQKQLQKELRRAIENGADEKTISAIQDEWNRNINDYTQTVNRLKRDIDRMGKSGQEAAQEASKESDSFTKFRVKDVGKYIEARTRALRAAIGKMIKDLRAKNEQREAEQEKFVNESARTVRAKAKEFNASVREQVSLIAAAYCSILSKMEKTFEKHLDKQIEELKKHQAKWEEEKQKAEKAKDERSAKDPVDLDKDPADDASEKEGKEPDSESKSQKDSEPKKKKHEQEQETEVKKKSQSKTHTGQEKEKTQKAKDQTSEKDPVDLDQSQEDHMPNTAARKMDTKNLEGLKEREDLEDDVPSKTEDEEYKNLEGLKEREDLEDDVPLKNTEEAAQSKESMPLTPESLKRLQEMMMLNGLKETAEKNGAEYAGRADESAETARDAAKEAEEAKREAEKAAEQAKVDELHGLSVDEAEKKILASLREQAELGEGKEVIYQDFDRDGDGKADTRFSIVPNSYQVLNYDNILKGLQDRKAKGEQTAGIDVDDKRYVNGINKDEPIDLAIAKAAKRAEDARSNREKAAKDPDIQDDKNYSYFISVEDLGIGKDGKVHGGSRNVQYGDEGFAHEAASNEEVRAGLFQKLIEYIKLLSKEGKMLAEKDQLWQEQHPVLAAGRKALAKGAAKGAKRGVSALAKAAEDGAR